MPIIIEIPIFPTLRGDLIKVGGQDQEILAVDDSIHIAITVKGIGDLRLIRWLDPRHGVVRNRQAPQP